MVSFKKFSRQLGKRQRKARRKFSRSLGKSLRRRKTGRRNIFEL